MCIYIKFTSFNKSGAHSVIIPGKGKSGPQGGGLSPGELTPGTFVTVSENKRICDRSLVDAIWEIIAINEAHCVLKFHCGNRPLDPALLTRIVPLHDTISTRRIIWPQPWKTSDRPRNIARIRECETPAHRTRLDP
jgi:hypothetical protein